MPVQKLNSRYLSKEQIPFELVSREAVDALHDPDTIALFLVMALRPDKWVFKAEWLKDRLNIGDHRYRQAMKALVEAGFIEYVTKRNTDGTISSRELVFRQVVSDALKVEDQRRGEPTDIESNSNIYNTPEDNISVVQSSDFDLFWQLYPRKAAKKPAMKKWNRLSKSDRQSILAHLKTSPYADRKPEFIPMPTTYLNQERWQDVEDASPEDLPLIGI